MQYRSPYIPTAKVQADLQIDIRNARAAGKPLRQAERRLARKAAKHAATEARRKIIAERRK